MMPITRPGVLVAARARAALGFVPQNGQTEALRSIKARQFGHMRSEVS